MEIKTVIYRLAVSLWVGGAALFTFLLTPALFKSYGRDMAGGIVGVLFPGYFRWGMVCGAVALICLFISRGRSAVASAIIISAMLIITALQAFVIEPRAVELKKTIPSFETTRDDPQRAEFRKLHGISAAGNLAVIGGGVALVALF
jgi:uncharacterized membrane protein